MSIGATKQIRKPTAQRAVDRRTADRTDGAWWASFAGRTEWRRARSAGDASGTGAGVADVIGRLHFQEGQLAPHRWGPRRRLWPGCVIALARRIRRVAE